MDYNTVANHIPSHRNKIERHSTERYSTGQNGIKKNSMERVVSFGADIVSVEIASSIKLGNCSL
jgi:hypothetical protein